MVVVEIPIDLRALALRGVLQEVPLPHLQDTGLENWTSTRIKPDSLMMRKERFCRISAVGAPVKKSADSLSAHCTIEIEAKK